MKWDWWSVAFVASVAFVVVVGVMTLSLLTACSPFGATPATTTSILEIQVKAEDNGHRIELSQGQILVVSLEARPSTGYSWNVEEFTPQVLSEEGETEFKSDSHLIGGPATQIMHFKAVGVGQTTLKLAYRRPWEEDVQPLKIFSLRVIVR